MKRARNLRFGLLSSPETRRGARQVVKIQRLRDRETGQEGSVVRKLDNGWLKVKWDNRNRATLIDPDQVMMTNGKQKSGVRSQKSAASRGRAKNLLGFGKKSKARRGKKLRKKAGILQAEANLLRARAANRSGQKKPTVRRAKNKAIRMTYALAMAAGQDAANRQMKKAGRTKWIRAEHNLAVATFEKLYGKQARLENKRFPNPPIWADIIGGLAGGAGYAAAAAWVGEKIKKAAGRKKNSRQSAVGSRQKNKPPAKLATKRARNHTPSTARLFKEFHGHDPSGKVLNLFTPSNTPKDVTMDGPIIDIRLKNGGVIRFAKTDRGALQSPKAFMGHAQRGASKRVYIGLVAPYGRQENGEPIARAVNHGPVASIAYWCAKPHLTGHDRPVPWEHKFGDRGGRLPNVVLLPSGCIDLRGGDYTVVSGGIDN